MAPELFDGVERGALEDRRDIFASLTQLAAESPKLIDRRRQFLGARTLAFNNMSGVGRGGTGVLRVDGREVASQHIARTLPFTCCFCRRDDIGRIELDELA